MKFLALVSIVAALSGLVQCEAAARTRYGWDITNLVAKHVGFHSSASM